MRATTLISSFLDTSGYTAAQIIQEARQLDLPEQAQVALDTLSNFEKSRGQAVEHLLAQLSLIDANLKLLRRNNALKALELPPSLLPSAYQLPLAQGGASLFGEGLSSVLALGEQLATKKHTRTMEKAVLDAMKKPKGRSSSTNSRQSSNSGKQSKKSQKRKANSSNTSSTEAPSKKKGPKSSGKGKKPQSDS